MSELDEGDVARQSRWDALLAAWRDLLPPASLIFCAGLVGLWTVVVSNRLRRHPHLLRFRRSLVWARIALGVVWLSSLAWMVLYVAGGG